MTRHDTAPAPELPKPEAAQTATSGDVDSYKRQDREAETRPAANADAQSLRASLDQSKKDERAPAA